MIIRNIGVLAVALALALTSAGCLDSKPDGDSILGVWDFDCNTGSGVSAIGMAFFKDGTGISNSRINKKDVETAFKWRLKDGNHLYITPASAGAEETEVFGIEFSDKGTYLTLFDKNSNREIYIKRTAKKAIAFGSFTDSRDDKEYKTVKIGSQVWFAENLNYEAIGSKCYDNDPANCAKYGRLYDWKAALKACPPDWHLPSNVEWDILYQNTEVNHCFAGSSGYSKSPYESKTAGKYLKSAAGWSDGGNGLDKYGFAALPSGIGREGDNFHSIGYDGSWWSATALSTGHAYYRILDYDYDGARWNGNDKTNLQGVRCLED